VVLRFEDRFFEDPRTIERIAAMFPAELPHGAAMRIFDELQRDAVDAFIGNLEALPTTESGLDEVTGQWDTYDDVTGWHKHHAGRTAEVGRWRRELTDLQAQTIQNHMQHWMERFGYLPMAPRRGRYVLSVGQFGIAG
jgi:hypothetical protein